MSIGSLKFPPQKFASCGNEPFMKRSEGMECSCLALREWLIQTCFNLECLQTARCARRGMVWQARLRRSWRGLTPPRLAPSSPVSPRLVPSRFVLSCPAPFRPVSPPPHPVQLRPTRFSMTIHFETANAGSHIDHFKGWFFPLILFKFRR